MIVAWASLLPSRRHGKSLWSHDQNWGRGNGKLRVWNLREGKREKDDFRNKNYFTIFSSFSFADECMVQNLRYVNECVSRSTIQSFDNSVGNAINLPGFQILNLS